MSGCGWGWAVARWSRVWSNRGCTCWSAAVGGGRQWSAAVGAASLQLQEETAQWHLDLVNDTGAESREFVGEAN